jgi:mitochondrial fission protein ELM1
MADPLVIWLLGDGKPGHENQTLGLAEALGRLHPCEIHRIAMGGGSWWARLAAARRAAAGLPAPALVLGAGHATHAALLWLARSHRARAVVLMRPSLPLGWFDGCVCPEHDFPNANPPASVITTVGALNRVVFDPQRPREGGLLLVGGPSGTHDWDGEGVLRHLRKITSGSAPGHWRLTTSRRTPEAMVSQLRSQLPEVAVFSHEQTDRDWVPAQLAGAAEVWVTEDSVSMIYEALSSGARVGLLPVPRKPGDSRVLRGLARLMAKGFVTTYEAWQKTGVVAAPPRVLREADRCAKDLLERLFAGIVKKNEI